MTFYAKLGSVSHATMRAEDLIPAFINCLSVLNDERALSDYVASVGELEATREYSRITDLLADIESRIDRPGYSNSDDSDYDLWETLCDELNEFAPPFCYFGSHPGDGSDYGFWVSEELLHPCRWFDADNDIVRVFDLSDAPESGYVLHVNDHGNATLYLDGAEIWSIV